MQSSPSLTICGLQPFARQVGQGWSAGRSGLMYRMPENAQPSSRGAERSTGDDGGFSDQKCGIAASQAGTAVATGTE